MPCSPRSDCAGVRQVLQRFDAGQEEIRPASYRCESRQPVNLLSNRTLRHLKLQRAVLVANDRIAFVAEFVKVPIVDPDVLRKLELADQTRADNKRCNPALVAVLGRAFWQGRAVR